MGSAAKPLGSHCYHYSWMGRLTGSYPASTAGFVPRSRPADTNFYACSSRRRIRLQADVIINRIVKTLFAPEVSLRRLN
jgi:hypothetical protein